MTTIPPWRSLLVTLLLLLMLPAAAQEQAAEQEQTQPPPVESAPRDLPTQLADLVDAITSTKQELSGVRQALRRAKEDQERDSLNADLERLNKRLSEQRLSLEKLATGGVDTRLFYESNETKFNLVQDFEEVVRPLLLELKKLTEHPRLVERLRGEQKYLQSRQAVAEQALAKIGEQKKSVDNNAVKKELGSLEEEWRQRRDDTQSKLTLVNLQLDELVNPDKRISGQLGSAIAEFLHERGINMLLGAGAFGLTYLAFYLSVRSLRRTLLHHQKLRSRFWPRVVLVVADTLTLTMSVLAAMMVLYTRGDWLNLGLLLIFLLAAAWTLRQSLPRHLMEARILLNMGPVRDGERVVYRGIPWEITNLGVFSTLYNPALNATFRLSLMELGELHSRPFAVGEPWFPSRTGDYVILDGDIFGKVLIQTPEVVQMQVVGSVKTFSVESYLALNPRNLSAEGFSLIVTFGLDYMHQPEITGRVRDELDQAVRERLAAHPTLHTHVSDIMVEFNGAGPSSLDFIIVVSMHGSAADKYFSARRFLQRVAVEACNAHGWVVPFDQLTVHVASDSA